MTAFFGTLLLAYEFFRKDLLARLNDERIFRLIDGSVTRALASFAFLAILFYLGYRVLHPFARPFFKSILFSLPAIAVVINNLPIYPLLSGKAYVTGSFGQIMLLFAECFFIGLFEETCFRGIVLLGFLEKRRGSVRGRFISVLLTSAVFGLVHIFNLFMGADILSVILQIGYSTLIGCMCSVILMKSANLWLCVMLHAIFDFCGALVPTFGEGIIWDGFTVTLTVILAVLTTAYLTAAFFKIQECELDRIYKK